MTVPSVQSTTVTAFVRAQRLWHDGASLLLAVSGGADSMAMLHLLATELGPAMGLRLAVGHVNHSLRAEAADDAAFVAARALDYHLPCFSRTVDVPARVAETDESVEEAARELRYAALRAMAAECGATVIATAHTADDQAETVLMRVLRGTGVTGLAGIPPRRDEIVRPLLPLWRSDIEAYLTACTLPHRIDASNASSAFLRNRIRHALLPLLERDYAPGLRARLAHLAELARMDTAYLDDCVDADGPALATLPTGAITVVDIDDARALRWRRWRRAIAAVRGGLADIGYEHLTAIEAMTLHGEVHLPGVRVLREDGQHVFLAMDDDACSLAETPLALPGAVELPGIGHLSATHAAQVLSLEGGDAAVLDATAVTGPLIVRGWLPGDRVQLLGAPGSRKLQDIFVDAGVPKRLRGQIPIVLDAHGICWIAGFRIADRVKMDAKTAATIRLQMQWEYQSPWTLSHS